MKRSIILIVTLLLVSFQFYGQTHAQFFKSVDNFLIKYVADGKSGLSIHQEKP